MNFEHAVPQMTRARQIRVLALSVAAVALVAAGASGLRAWLHQPEPAPVALPAGEVQLTDSQVSSLKIEAVAADDGFARTGASGQIAVDDTRSTPVFLPYSGQVQKVFVQNGDRVSAGTPLLSVRTTDIADARNALAAALAQRTAAAAQVRVANDNAARAEEVYRTAGGALKDLQQARSDLVAAQSQVGIADAAVTAARAKLSVFGANGGSGGEAVLRAPIGGVVVTRAIAQGQYVSGGTAGGSTPSFLIADLSQVWLVAQVAESDASRVHLGDKVVVTATAYPGRTFDATINNIAAQIDPVSHRLQVRATIPNPDGALKPQMFANFTIETPDKEVMAQAVTPHLLSLPVEAVIHEGDSARVWVWLGHGRVKERDVVTGESHDGRITILSGLNPGEKVVTEGAIFVNEAGLD
ncbi:MAG: efflux RND transporter periplasmic adaptor subunit [Novosphingobium aromaticivorans]|jgi:cobalt-zinc-cadmium efflux system membrane fusion protein|nr:efflux RND transporter periplasmic adaptor subunit [Novosphingobium aromaticivorans]